MEHRKEIVGYLTRKHIYEIAVIKSQVIFFSWLGKIKSNAEFQTAIFYEKISRKNADSTHKWFNTIEILIIFLQNYLSYNFYGGFRTNAISLLSLNFLF